MTEAALFWLFALAITVHNIEEGLFLPAFTASVPRLAEHSTPFSFRFALIVLTGAVYIVVAFAAAGVASAITLLSGLALVMAINAVAPHLVLTLVFRRYAPGTATGLFIMTPLSILLIVRNAAGGHIDGYALAVATISVAVAVIIAIPALIYAGRFIERYLPHPTGEAA